MIDENMVRCAQINFENFEKVFPIVKKHPYYIVARAQLDEALGEVGALEKRSGGAKELGSITFNSDGSVIKTGIMKEATFTKESE